MMLGVAYGRTIALACALVALTYASDVRAQTAPRAAALGPEVVDGGAVGRLCRAASRRARERSGRHAADRDRRGLPARADLRSGLAHGEGAVEGHDRGIFRPRVPAGRLPDRDREERQVRPHRRALRRAGGFRLHARHRRAARQSSAHADRVQSRHDRAHRRRDLGPDRHADRSRGAGHRLARARRQLGAALRQQVHRLHVGGDDERHRAFQRAGHRPYRPAHPGDPAHRLRLALSQHPAVAGAGPPAVQARIHRHAGRAGAAAAAGRAGADAGALAAAAGRARRHAGLLGDRSAGRGRGGGL